ncbi:MAG: dihydrofolate reductase [Burkholderiales bacterium]
MTDSTRRISIIAAMAQNRVIGKDNRIPWHLPRELQMFKRLTLGHHIIMGRKTYASLNRLLPGRTTVIVTRDPNYKIPGAISVNSLQAALASCGDDHEIFVIGGAQLFRAALPLAQRIYLTTVQAQIEGDTFMPELDLAEWRQVSRKEFKADEKNPYDYIYSVYHK